MLAIILLLLTPEERIRTVLEREKVPAFTIELIVAQAKAESGNFTSKLYREHNNLFGSLHPKKRYTTSLGPYARAEKRNGYASYFSIEDSVLDHLSYLKYHRYPMTYKSSYQYVRLLKKKKYFEAKLSHYQRLISFYLWEAKQNKLE